MKVFLSPTLSRASSAELRDPPNSSLEFNQKREREREALSIIIYAKGDRNEPLFSSGILQWENV